MPPEDFDALFHRGVPQAVEVEEAGGSPILMCRVVGAGGIGRWDGAGGVIIVVAAASVFRAMVLAGSAAVRMKIEAALEIVLIERQPKNLKEKRPKAYHKGQVPEMLISHGSMQGG